jgi:predicted DNA-binding transcriptional regulator AlpA
MPDERGLEDEQLADPFETERPGKVAWFKSEALTGHRAICRGDVMENVMQFPKNKELTHSEAAAYLGLSPRTLYNKNNSGKGPRRTRRFGRVVYLVVDLDAFKRSVSTVREAGA